MSKLLGETSGNWCVGVQTYASSSDCTQTKKVLVGDAISASLNDTLLQMCLHQSTTTFVLIFKFICHSQVIFTLPTMSEVF